MDEPSQKAKLAAIAAIEDPTRRALFDFVARSEHPVGRDDAAAATGLARSTAVFHLDRLVEAGLLVTESSRRTGRTGPGAGRPAKLYRRAVGEISVAVPERHYDLMGDVLAAAIESADESGAAIRQTLTTAARERGRELGASAGSLTGVLESAGYEPENDGSGVITLTNCPFHRLAASHTEIICAANVALLKGAAEGCGDSEHGILFEPSAGHCCVRLTRAG